MASRANYVANYCCSNIRFSPFESNKLLLSQAQNYGSFENGWVSLLSIDEHGIMNVLQEYFMPDSWYDACFNEENENQILTASSDSTLQLWDFMETKPVLTYKEHQLEVYSWEWSHIDKRRFL